MYLYESLTLSNIAEIKKNMLPFEFARSNLFIKVSVNLEVLFWSWLCIALGLIRKESLRSRV